MSHNFSRREALAGIAALAAFPLAGCTTYQTNLHGDLGGDHSATAHNSKKRMNLERSSFGSLPDGSSVALFTFKNQRGTTLKVMNYGLIITELHTLDRVGKLGNVVLGFDNLPRYLAGHPFFGAIAGRVANRIGKGRFTLDGQAYQLATNNGANHLHGGNVGFDKKLWTVEGEEITPEFARVWFAYRSPDGEENYPGKLQVRVEYTLTQTDEVRIVYQAVTDQATPINLTNHSYFNLAGRGDVHGHELQIMADRYTPTDEGLIPTGELAGVRGTPLDFTAPHLIGERIEQTGLKPSGYDHNFVLNSGGRSLALAARVTESGSGRVMEVLTDQPGVQLYTANHFGPDGIEYNGGVRFPRHGALCLETQNFPDAINHPNFPKAVLRPGEVYRHATTFRFSAR